MLVPEVGSILGPVLFFIYSLLLGMLFLKHKVNFYLHADDAQIYAPICKGPDPMIKTIIDCLADDKFWMSASFFLAKMKAKLR